MSFMFVANIGEHGKTLIFRPGTLCCLHCVNVPLRRSRTASLAMANGPPLLIPKWVPDRAREELNRQVERFPDRSILERLASHSRMRERVWARLPPAAKGRENDVISLTISATWIAAKGVPTLLPEVAGAAFNSERLLDAMKKWSAADREHLQSAWPGTTFDHALALVGELARACQEVNEKYVALVNAAYFPRHHRKRFYRKAGGGSDLSKWDFALFLITQFQKFFGKPCFSVVSTLSAIVFDDGGMSADALRKLWKQQLRAMHSREKTEHSRKQLAAMFRA
jgi:hypothetical protein